MRKRWRHWYGAATPAVPEALTAQQAAADVHAGGAGAVGVEVKTHARLQTGLSRLGGSSGVKEVVCLQEGG